MAMPHGHAIGHGPGITLPPEAGLSPSACQKLPAKKAGLLPGGLRLKGPRGLALAAMAGSAAGCRAWRSLV